MVLFERPRRRPGFAVAVLLLRYAAGTAAFAARSRLGFPGGQGRVRGAVLAGVPRRAADVGR
ncbi:hypothetical protein [Actinoallomurus rhizosphaericola]|uniref:hypothetical protein n=1 Tax=Actinoallomurus rhizosphaericola TaxID=2952536 RepID=UPI0020917AA5|nr:hypothetical protein [Actinoallomurus rhizosphaericola]MCO5993205.1 hypothetical protein [Actinoallomurus rhizosphaericola]